MSAGAHPQLLHLSGPHRGRTITYKKNKLLFGSAEGVDVRYPEGGVVAPQHAELTYSQKSCSFHMLATGGDVFVNQRQVQEVILEHGDLVEMGWGGPRMRFRIQQEDCRSCKPVYQMLRDAGEVGRTSGARAFGGSLTRDLLTQATWKLKIGFPLLVLGVVFGVAYFGGSMGGREQAARHQEYDRYEDEIARLRGQFKALREAAGGMSREDIDKLRAEVSRQRGVVDQMVQRNASLKRVLQVHSRGVCLLHGTFTLKHRVGGRMVPIPSPSGGPLRLEYVGSGFLVSAKGHVVTNRHVAEPWFRDQTIAPMIAAGLVPELLTLEAVFPGKAPVPVVPATIRVSKEGVDEAVLEVKVEGVPVLPLFDGDPMTWRGERVILLGYPTGLKALLGRTEPNVMAEILAVATDTTTLIAELSKRDAISPVITQGALNEVKERRLVYDAETTSGGSGGPVFGPDGTVIGINFAITPDFDGSNFGVPILFAKKLLP